MGKIKESQKIFLRVTKIESTLKRKNSTRRYQFKKIIKDKIERDWKPIANGKEYFFQYFKKNYISIYVLNSMICTLAESFVVRLSSSALFFCSRLDILFIKEVNRNHI